MRELRLTAEQLKALNVPVERTPKVQTTVDVIQRDMDLQDVWDLGGGCLTQDQRRSLRLAEDLALKPQGSRIRKILPLFPAPTCPAVAVQESYWSMADGHAHWTVEHVEGTGGRCERPTAVRGTLWHDMATYGHLKSFDPGLAYWLYASADGRGQQEGCWRG
jgi:hypothetical protein